MTAGPDGFRDPDPNRTSTSRAIECLGFPGSSVRPFPARLIRPIRWLPPVECSSGVNPAQAARRRPGSNCAASISMASANAMIGPVRGDNQG